MVNPAAYHHLSVGRAVIEVVVPPPAQPATASRRLRLQKADVMFPKGVLRIACSASPTTRTPFGRIGVTIPISPGSANTPFGVGIGTGTWVHRGAVCSNSEASQGGRMSRLKEKDIADLLDCVRDVYAITDLATFGDRLIASVRNVLSCSGVVFGNCDLRSMRSEFVTDRPDSLKLPAAEIVATLPRNHQHPYWSHYLRTLDPRATKLSDFMSRRELHSKGFYTDLYKPIKAEAEIGCMLIIAPQSHLTYIAAIRDRTDFSERDRTVLNLLQPHLGQAYRNAGALTALRDESGLARRLIECLDHGLIVRSPKGAVRLLTAQARTWLAEYFPSHQRTDRLPVLLEDWIKHQGTLFGRRDSVPDPLRPLVLIREGRKLVVRLIPEGDQAILVLAEERTTIDPRSLERMGLTRREAEVSAWMAGGKTNAEIGEILRIHPMTVKKHLEHIFQKLGVENRTAAAGLVLSHQKR
jgi:DNA-binding CsgD family transcriptional regulator